MSNCDSKKEAYSNQVIARLLGHPHQIIHNEIKRGPVMQLKRQKQNGKLHDYSYTVYDADVGHTNYEHQLLNSGRRAKWMLSSLFVE